MKAVKRHLEEIKEKENIMKKTDSVYLKNDIAKNIHQLKKELKEYCHYRGYDFKEIIKNAKLL